MKNTAKLLALLILCGVCADAGAASAALSWQQPGGTNGVVAWHAYEVAGVTTARVGQASTTQLVLTGIVAGSHCYMVSASNIWGESGFSNLACVPPAAGSPSSLVITLTITVP